MTKAEALKLLAFLSAHYGGTTVTETSLAAYAGRLVNYPADIAQRAAEGLVLRSEWFPSLAALVDAIVREHTGLPEPEEAWALVAEAWSKGDADGMRDLHETVRRASKLSGGWHAMSTQPLHLVRESFLATYRGLRTVAVDHAREVDLPLLAAATRPALKAGT